MVKLTAVNIEFDHGQYFVHVRAMGRMGRTPQKRKIATRGRLIEAAEQIASQNGLEALRVEEVVAQAKVAKGTFFSHFKDKDAVLAVLLGDRLQVALDVVRAGPVPETPEDFADALEPVLAVMAQERLAFDISFRYSGASTMQDPGPIAQNFIGQVDVLKGWLESGQVSDLRDDLSPELLAEGVQSFMMQAIALSFCAVNSAVDRRERLRTYLSAWLRAPKTA